LGKTEWYNGANRVGTGYLLDVLPGAGDYSVLLFTTTGEVFASCKESGNAPDITPVLPDGNRINLIASSFGSRVVAGGTNLILDTPFGGTVSIYTMRGELLSTMPAVDARTVVKIPSTKGMYIVKLEAK
jgi:hypothetical protein